VPGIHPGSFVRGPIPAQAGIGLRGDHARELLHARPRLGFLEVHSENYFGAGGAPVDVLGLLREHYPLSMHGVGLSLGSTDPLDHKHLQQLARAIARFEPALVSEHLAWSSNNGRYLHDLAPLPYTEEALDHFCARVRQVQDFLGRRILVENVSSYLRYRHSTIPEWEFLAAVAQRCDCGILLDVNNIYVNAVNHGFDALTYLDAIPAGHVGEIHLAGFTERDTGAAPLLIDTHNRPVADAVWELFDRATELYGPVPALVEWDSDLPALDVLLDQAARAQDVLERHLARVA